MDKKNISSNNKNDKALNEIKNFSYLKGEEIFEKLYSRLDGLTEKQVKEKTTQYGLNSIANEKPKTVLSRLADNIKNPLNILLIVLAIISYLTGDIRAMIVILIMVVMGIVLRLLQEVRADNAAQKLKAMISTKATVIRNKKDIDIPIKFLVPGDIVKLAAGDMIPADIVLLSSKDLYINQSSLTGESIPVEKHAGINKDIEDLFDIQNICFLGSNVTSGTALAIVVSTGNKTYFGSLAKSIINNQTVTSFDKGINKFTWMMIKFILIMVPLVFLINGISKHDWLEAFLFAMAVAVGLTPEMVPMIVSVNLSKGALMMSKKKVIVKKLNSIQNLGAMDVLCTDKTGTITDGKTTLESHIDILGNSSHKVLDYGYLNSYFHTGLKNIMDETILEHGKLDKMDGIRNEYSKIDEIPFDFDRKRMSVVIENKLDVHSLICKGAFEEIMDCCTHMEIEEKILPLTNKHKDEVKKVIDDLNSKGFRVVALAYKEIANTDTSVYSIKDETNLTLLGFLSFLDPPKKTATQAIKKLNDLGIAVKILTGDNDRVTRHICEEVGINTENLLLGSQIEEMSEEELTEAVNKTNIFVKLAPNQKEKIIRCLQKNGHVVGFMGDGINDAPALKTSDVGISVNSAVDIAKESSDIILLDNSLLVLEQGVLEGRRVFGNIIKYIKMAASSNFGNMFSVVGASAFLPFLPMLPIQVITNNLLYDLSQTTIPTDNVDEDWLKTPRKWKMDRIQKFVLLIGPISSIFDYITFFVMLNVFNCWNNPELFHTGWFIESIFTQTLIIHVIRTNKIPFIESRAKWPLMLSSLIIVLVATLLTISPLAPALGFVALPLGYWGILAVMMFAYVILTQIVKSIIIKKLDI